MRWPRSAYDVTVLRVKEKAYKLGGVFKSNSQAPLQRLSNTADNESTAFSEPSLSLTVIILHSVAILFTFLAICTMAAVAAFQAKWFKVSGGTGFTLTLLVLAFLLSCCLLAVPLIYDRYDKCRRAAQFLSQARAAFIWHVFGTLLMIIACFVVTIGAWGTNKGCKNPDDDPHEKLGDDYKKGLKGWCQTKRASSIFDWFALAAWIALLVMSGIAFNRERRNPREPGFIAPSSPGGYDETSHPERQYEAVRPIPVGDDDVFADKHEVFSQPPQLQEPRPQQLQQSYPLSPPQPNAIPPHSQPYNYGRPNHVLPHHEPTALSRPSVDVYGAFDGDMPGAQSRTMQMAYNDPYADIRATVLSDVGYAQPQTPPVPMPPQQYSTPPPQRPYNY